MRRIGFIREKKEIEYLILYVMTLLKEPVRYEDLADMAICDGGFGYLEFSDAMAELIALGHIAITEREGIKYYGLTETGEAAAHAFEKRIPSAVRLEAGRAVGNVYRRMYREATVVARHGLREDGTMSVHLAIMDADTPVFSFELMVPDENHARMYERNFRKYAERMYDGMICVLLNQYEEEEEEQFP